MRYVRKLFVLVAMATTAMAFAATSASAQAVELSQEVDGVNTHCGAVHVENHIPTGGCNVRAISTETAILVRHTGVAEVEFSECENVFEARVNEDGHGYVYNQQLTPVGDPCGREPCDEGEASANPHDDIPWEVQLREANPPVVGNHQETLRVTFCLSALDLDPATEGTAGTPCTVDLGVTQVDHALSIETPRFDDDHNFGAPCMNLGGIVELQGAWTTAPNANHPNLIEITHL